MCVCFMFGSVGARMGVRSVCSTVLADVCVCQCYDILPHDAEHSSGLCSNSNQVRCDKFKNSLHVQEPGLAHGLC